MPEATPDNPGVHVPPPLFYVAAIAAGELLERRVPLSIGGGSLRVLAAWALVAAFVVLMASGFASFWRRHTTIIPNKPATALVVAGPYRFTRNPLYVAMALLTIGAALWLNTWWVLLFLPLALLAIDRLVIAREEQYLRRRFGSEYEAYMRRVRRWI